MSGYGRFVGHPLLEKNMRSATPIQISGMTTGRATVPSQRNFPGNLNLHNTIAVAAPISVAMSVAAIAIEIEFVKASISESLFHAF